MKSLIGLRLALPYCNGYFSANYDLKDASIEAVGRDWVVVRLKDGSTRFQSFAWPRREIKEAIREWATPEAENAE